MKLCLMGSLVTISFLLVVFTVGIKESVGRKLTMVKEFVYSSTQRGKGFLHRLAKNLT
jgi:hypothetical protein